METENRTTLRKFLKGFTFAFAGIAYAFRTQCNMRFHVYSSVAVIALSFYLHIDIAEWCIILMCIGSVYAAELINTSIETTVYFASPEISDKAGHAKDLAAAAVLVVCTVSAVIGLIIFLPKIIQLFS
jgi:diacylglycerol kinase (ATP)